MSKTSQIVSALLLSLPLAATSALAQALPTAEASPVSTGFSLPSSLGSLQYALSASDTLSSGYYATPGVVAATNLTGDLAYLSNSKLDPFNLVLSGGHSWATSGQPSFSFVDLSGSQVLNYGRWDFLLADSVNYLPGTPIAGLSGVPGVGDLGVSPLPVAGPGAGPGTGPGTGPSTGQGVLTGFSSQVANSASASVQRQLTGKTSLRVADSYAIMRFVGNSSDPGNAGLDGDSETGSLALNHRIDARNSIGGNYAYSLYTYSSNGLGDTQPSFSSQTVSLQYSHNFTRKLYASLAAGPQRTEIDFPGATPALTLFASLSATYTGQFSHLSLAYTRSTNSGFGVVGGAISDSVASSAARTFNRVWLGALTSAYTQTADLPSAATLPFTFHTTVAGVQLSRAIGRSFSAYASYTLEDQSNQGAAATTNLFSGLSKVAGFGLTYSPAARRLGHP